VRIISSPRQLTGSVIDWRNPPLVHYPGDMQITHEFSDGSTTAEPYSEFIEKCEQVPKQHDGPVWRDWCKVVERMRLNEP